MTLFEFIKTIALTTFLLYLIPFFSESIKKQYLPLVEPHTPIAIIKIKDNLYCSHDIMHQLHHFFKKPTIKGIVMKIDCSDSAVGTAQILFHTIRQLKQEFPKPIIALIENSCLAGAYLVASACDYIIAPESALIGNIGPNSNETILKKINSINEHNRESIESDTYQQLTKHIALSRKLSLTTIHNWGNGKIFTANQALAIGLINETGAMHTVIKTIKERALIEDEIELIEQKVLSLPKMYS